ncbi:hypothetical protein Q8A67_004922 [Cirrhinus molitorella]|uniref:C-type lectin domain-containing protein n=1 Tax=Cirrhinus molitorella TaxID=172907 RepID=A0AA88Q665_9TELE|nr:hypothetical protein Q8A67_004922 [Cirrhinus molitorella]
MTLLFVSGNFLTLERGDVAGRTNATARCPTPKKCNIYGFSDWYKVGSYCVKFFSKRLNFTAAEYSCRNKVPGAHLVSVHNEEDHNLLVNIVKQADKSNPRVWLGAFELFKSGTFLWLDGSFWDFEFWKPGEPNHMHNAEDCVEMYLSDAGRWIDESCGKEKSYICAFKWHTILKPGSVKME